MTDKKRMLSGLLYNPYEIQDGVHYACSDTIEVFNRLSWRDFRKGTELLQEIFGHLEDDAIITQPFYCDYGRQIFIGKHFYANTGLIILDAAKVTIGDDVFIGPRVSIFTASHPIDPDVRRKEYEIAKEVSIGNDVWIGGNTVINPGVSIGNNVVIGSGSVVTKNIPDNVIAAGNPCRVIREITDTDKQYWQQQLDEYLSDPDVSDNNC